MGSLLDSFVALDDFDIDFDELEAEESELTCATCPMRNDDFCNMALCPIQNME